MLPLHECPVCSQLGEHETAYFKYGWPEDDKPMPEVVKELVELRSNSRRHKLMGCPHCGRVYQWDHEYDYLVNGSEDYYDLTRLDEAAVKECLPEAEFAEWKAKWGVK